MTMLAGRDDVKALNLCALFEAAVRGEEMTFEHGDQDTFEFAIRHARTATQRLLDSAGECFSGRIRVLTDPARRMVTYCSAGTRRSPASRQAHRREEPVAATGAVIETRRLLGGSKQIGPGIFTIEDSSVVDEEIIYGCQPGCKLSVGLPAARGDDIRCAHCGRTNASAAIEFGNLAIQDDTAGDEEDAGQPTIRAYFRIEDGRAIRILRRVRKQQTRKQLHDGDLGEAIQEAAVAARKARAKHARERRAARRG